MKRRRTHHLTKTKPKKKEKRKKQKTKNKKPTLQRKSKEKRKKEQANVTKEKSKKKKEKKKEKKLETLIRGEGSFVQIFFSLFSGKCHFLLYFSLPIFHHSCFHPNQTYP